MAKSSESRGFLRSAGIRILAAAILVPLAILVFMRGGWLFALATTALALALLREYDSLAQARGQGRLFAPLALPLLIILGAAKFFGADGALGAWLLLGLILMGTSALHGRIEGATARVAERLMVLFYLGLLPAHFILLRELPLEVGGMPYRAGAHWALYGAGITWLGDTFAYFVGSLLGRHSLGTAVSPRKSVEGMLGGLGGALLTAWLLAPAWAPSLRLWQILLLGLLLSLTGQLGDLFESLLKRDAAKKDSGDSIPGHGGWLDRVDSLLFTFPLLYYFLRWTIL